MAALVVSVSGTPHMISYVTTPESLTILTAAIAAFVAIGVFIAGQFVRAVDARRERRRELVVRMIETVDGVVRHQTLPAILRHWRPTEMELALAQSRLVMDLGEKDLVIAWWVWGQTQRVLLTTTRSEHIRAAAAITNRLVQWHRGTIKRQWFADEIKRTAVIPDFTVPASVAWKRNFKALGETTVILGGAAALLFGVKQIFVGRAPALASA